jgi:hypothetical protein
MKKRKLVVSDTSLSPDVTGALGGGPGSMGKFIVERPIGAINGVNVDFYLRYTPLPWFLPFLILNGLDDVSESNTFETAVPTAQYSMSGNRATFYQAPQPGDRIVAKYWQGTGVLLTVASATIHVWTQKLASPYSSFVVGTYFAPDTTPTTVIPYANAPYSLTQDTATVFTGNCGAGGLHRSPDVVCPRWQCVRRRAGRSPDLGLLFEPDALRWLRDDDPPDELFVLFGGIGESALLATVDGLHGGRCSDRFEQQQANREHQRQKRNGVSELVYFRDDVRGHDVLDL